MAYPRKKEEDLTALQKQVYEQVKNLPKGQGILSVTIARKLGLKTTQVSSVLNELRSHGLVRAERHTHNHRACYLNFMVDPNEPGLPKPIVDKPLRTIHGKRKSQQKKDPHTRALEAAGKIYKEFEVLVTAINEMKDQHDKLEEVRTMLKF